MMRVLVAGTAARRATGRTIAIPSHREGCTATIPSGVDAAQQSLLTGGGEGSSSSYEVVTRRSSTTASRLSFSRSGVEVSGSNTLPGWPQSLREHSSSRSLRHETKRSLRTLGLTRSTTYDPWSPLLLSSPLPRVHVVPRRWFESESEYHPVADATLEHLVDHVEAALEAIVGDDDEFEVNLAAGVLTVSLPPHGTWVINKQTPNRQLWWSSPLSGPQRYEYNAAEHLWFSTKDGLFLLPLLSQELSHVTGKTIVIPAEEE